MRRRAFVLGTVSALWAGASAGDEALWARLKAGGHVVLVRHALTTPGVGDPEGFRLGECGTQRNLSEEGRSEAARLGALLRERGVPVGRVYSSPWCRCLETARIALGREPDVQPSLGNLFGRPELEARQIAALRPLAARRPESGNTFMFSHGSTIHALTGISPATAEMVVLAPRAGGFSVAGRLPPAR